MRNFHLIRNTQKTVSLCSPLKHPEFCYRDASDKTWPVSWNCNWSFYTGNTKVEFQKKLDCRIPSVNTVFHGSEDTSYQDPKNREIVPVKINEFISLNNAKKEIRNWVPQNCPCRHRKQYLIDVVFFHDI